MAGDTAVPTQTSFKTKEEEEEGRISLAAARWYRRLCTLIPQLTDSAYSYVDLAAELAVNLPSGKACQTRAYLLFRCHRCPESPARDSGCQKVEILPLAVSALAWSKCSCWPLRGNFNMFTTRRSSDRSQEQSTQLDGDSWWELSALAFFCFFFFNSWFNI